LASIDGASIDDGDVLEGVLWTGDGLEPSTGDLQVVGSRLSGVRLTGAEIEGLTLLDTIVDSCELSGGVVSGWRCERVAFSDCRMTGIVAADFRARHVRFSNCQLDGAWLRSASFDHCELVDCDLTGADLYGSRLVASRLVRCRLDGVELSGVDADELALHGSSISGAKGIASLQKLIIGTDQVMELAIPLLVARGIRIDDDYLPAD
jgi:uncharacterized protein YjbI with pentapeptide repeats